MKTFRHLWQYLAEFFLQWEIFQIKVVDKIKIHILRSVHFSENLAVYERNSKNMVRPEAADGNRAELACWISTAKRVQAHASVLAPTPTHTHTHALAHIHRMCKTFIFHGNNCYANAPQWYVIRTLPVLCILLTSARASCMSRPFHTTNKGLWKSTYYEDPHYAIFSICYTDEWQNRRSLAERSFV